MDERQNYLLNDNTLIELRIVLIFFQINKKINLLRENEISGCFFSKVQHNELALFL